MNEFTKLHKWFYLVLLSVLDTNRQCLLYGIINCIKKKIVQKKTLVLKCTLFDSNILQVYTSNDGRVSLCDTDCVSYGIYDQTL